MAEQLDRGDMESSPYISEGVTPSLDVKTRFVTSSSLSDALRRMGGRNVGDDADLLLKAADAIDSLRDALFWCGGSPSFGPGGEAEVGWREMVRPLMQATV